MAEIVSKPTNQAYRDGWDRTFGKEFPDQPMGCRVPELPCPVCEGIVDVDVNKYPYWPVRLPKAVYAYLEIAAAQEDAYEKMGEVGAYLQFEPTRQRSWAALSEDEQNQVARLMAKRRKG